MPESCALVPLGAGSAGPAAGAAHQAGAQGL